jgi:hypothetical protein
VRINPGDLRIGEEPFDSWLKIAFGEDGRCASSSPAARRSVEIEREMSLNIKDPEARDDPRAHTLSDFRVPGSSTIEATSGATEQVVIPLYRP